MKNELQLVIEQEKIAPTQAEFLLENFKNIFETAKEYEIKAREIKITDVSQVKEMQEARAIRLELKNLRVNADKKRKELKEESLRTGKAIQGIYNVVEALIVPMEKYLEDQEKFAERIEEQKKKEKELERQKQLSEFVEDTSLYNLLEMSEAGFQELLKASETAYNARIKAEKDAEDARIKEEKEKQAENERIRKENEELKKEQAKKDALIQKQKEEKEALIKKQQAELAEEKRKRDEQEAKIAKEKAEAEEKEKKEAEEKRQANLAPDKEKLAMLANDLILFPYPEIKDEEALKVLENVKELIKKVNLYIIKNINNL
jgi:hypothetical protein